MRTLTTSSEVNAAGLPVCYITSKLTLEEAQELAAAVAARHQISTWFLAIDCHVLCGDGYTPDPTVVTARNFYGIRCHAAPLDCVELLLLDAEAYQMPELLPA